MRTLAIAVMVLAFTGVVCAADDKIDAKMLLGVWEPANPKKGEPKLVYAFAENGQLTVKAKGGEKQFEGTYKLNGTKLHIEIPKFILDTDHKETWAISKLTNDEAIWKNEKGDQDTWKKIKEGGADVKKLIGRWESTKPKDSDPKMVIELTEIEFTEKGNLTLHLTSAEGKPVRIDGTYKLFGNELNVDIPKFIFGDYKETWIISKLTNDEWVFKGWSDKDKQETWKKIKPKK